MGTPQAGGFLPSLAAAAAQAHAEGASLTTASFTALIDQVVRVFDYLGGCWAAADAPAAGTAGQA